MMMRMHDEEGRPLVSLPLSTVFDTMGLYAK